MFPVGKKSYLMPSREECPSDAVVVFQSELDYLSRYILDYPNIETGGQLFGYWTSTGVPVVHYVLGPGENANHQYAFFNQDPDYLERVGGWLVRDFGLQHIGEWHSHHQLGLARPSIHDTHTFLECMRSYDLPRFLMCIGNCTETTSTINAFNYVAGSSCYQEAHWDVMPLESPFRKEIDRRLEGCLLHPQTRHASLDGMKYRRSRGVSYPQGYWMNDTNNNMELKQILEFLQSKSEGMQCSVILDEHGLVHIQSKDKRQNVLQDVLFPMGFPVKFPFSPMKSKGYVQPRWGGPTKTEASPRPLLNTIICMRYDDPEKKSGRVESAAGEASDKYLSLYGHGDGQPVYGDCSQNKHRECLYFENRIGRLP